MDGLFYVSSLGKEDVSCSERIYIGCKHGVGEAEAGPVQGQAQSL